MRDFKLNSYLLKKELKELLTKHNLTLYEDDGLWANLHPRFDLIGFAAYPNTIKSLAFDKQPSFREVFDA